jgi:hypothetical protein
VIGGVIGGILGFVVGGPFGALVGAGIGAGAGGVAGSWCWQTHQIDMHGDKSTLFGGDWCCRTAGETMLIERNTILYRGTGSSPVKSYYKDPQESASQVVFSSENHPTPAFSAIRCVKSLRAIRCTPPSG